MENMTFLKYSGWLMQTIFCIYCLIFYLRLFHAEFNPMPTEEMVQHFNELRQDIVLLYELKLALASCEYELQMLRLRYDTLNPAKVRLRIAYNYSGFMFLVYRNMILHTHAWNRYYLIFCHLDLDHINTLKDIHAFAAFFVTASNFDKR